MYITWFDAAGIQARAENCSRNGILESKADGRVLDITWSDGLLKQIFKQEGQRATIQVKYDKILVEDMRRKHIDTIVNPTDMFTEVLSFKLLQRHLKMINLM